MDKLLSDSISESMQAIKDVLSQMPPGQRNQAKRAAVVIENAINGLQRDFPRDPAVALGTAFALFRMCEQFIERDQPDTGKSLIQLLS